MRTLLRRGFKFVVLGLAVGGAALCYGSAPQKDFVTLPALTVYGSWIAVNYHQGDDGRITRVLIREVTPNSPAARSDLRKGDELIAIDELPVAGMSPEQFAEAYSTDLGRNRTRDYDFRCHRGFFVTRERIVRFRLTN